MIVNYKKLDIPAVTVICIRYNTYLSHKEPSYIADWKQKEMEDARVFLRSKSVSSIIMHFLLGVSLSDNRKKHHVNLYISPTSVCSAFYFVLDY
jgi:hypothetical protein